MLALMGGLWTRATLATGWPKEILGKSLDERIAVLLALLPGVTPW